MEYKESPCLRCVRVQDPENCENKRCGVWQNWFLNRWEQLRAYPWLQMDAPREKEGVVIGGCRYAPPHRVRDYLRRDPCQSCSCPSSLCLIPCRARKTWAATRAAVGV